MDFSSLLDMFGSQPMAVNVGGAQMPASLNTPSLGQVAGGMPQMDQGGGGWASLMGKLGQGQQQDNGAGLSAYHPIHSDIFAHLMNYLGQLG